MAHAVQLEVGQGKLARHILQPPLLVQRVHTAAVQVRSQGSPPQLLPSEPLSVCRGICLVSHNAPSSKITSKCAAPGKTLTACLQAIEAATPAAAEAVAELDSAKLEAAKTLLLLADPAALALSPAMPSKVGCGTCRGAGSEPGQAATLFLPLSTAAGTSCTSLQVVLPRCLHWFLCCCLLSCWRHQLQCCLPLVPNAPQMRASASSPAKVQPTREGTPTRPLQLLQAPEALQRELPATPPVVAMWAAKWRTRPRYPVIKIRGKLVRCRALPPIQGADSREEGTPHRPLSSTAAPLASPPPCGSDGGDVSQPQVSICPACSLTGSLDSVCPQDSVCTPSYLSLSGADLVQAPGPASCCAVLDTCTSCCPLFARAALCHATVSWHLISCNAASHRWQCPAGGKEPHRRPLPRVAPALPLSTRGKSGMQWWLLVVNRHSLPP